MWTKLVVPLTAASGFKAQCRRRRHLYRVPDFVDITVSTHLSEPAWTIVRQLPPECNEK
jgi:hypothetical protein